MEKFSIPDPVCKAKVILGPPRQNRGARALSCEPCRTGPVRCPRMPEAGTGRCACRCVTRDSWLWLLLRPPNYTGKVGVGAPVSSAEVGRAPDVPPPTVCASATPVPAPLPLFRRQGLLATSGRLAPTLTHRRQTDKGTEAPALLRVPRSTCLRPGPRTQVPLPLFVWVLGRRDRLQDGRASRQDLGTCHHEPRQHRPIGDTPPSLGTSLLLHSMGFKLFP